MAILGQNQLSQSPKTVRIGIVGGGFGALMAYAMLRFRGIKRHEIAVFAPNSSPEQSWGNYAQAINLQSLRSESTGHFYPTDSPGLATIESWNMWSIRPIVQSWFNRYHPSVERFIAHTKTIARQTGFYKALTVTHIGHIERYNGWFGLYDTKGSFLVFAQHVILAIGHGKHRIPQPVQVFRDAHAHDSRVTLSYEKKSYAPPRTVAVIGDGLTAGTEWINILETGGSVIAVSLHGFSFGQALNCPRPYLSRLGLAPYRNQSDEDRVKEIQHATKGTIPRYSRWKKLLNQATKEGRLQMIVGNLTDIQAIGDNQIQCSIEISHGKESRVITVDQVISATGFMPPATNPLLASLINKYGLKTMGGFLLVDDSCLVESLSTPISSLFTIGSGATWAFPCADQLSGLKLAARAIVKRIVGPETWSIDALKQQYMNWVTLIRGRELL